MNKPDKRRRRTQQLLFPLILLLTALLVVTGCTSDEASAGAQVAIVGDSEGSVEWAAADSGDWQAVQDEQELSPGQTMRTAAGSHAWLTYPDGSKTLVGPESELTITELSVDQAQAQRVIRLQQPRGESRHVVLQHEAANSTFEVHTPAGVSRTNEGTFSVSAAGAETAQAETRVAVTSGLVRCDSGGEAYPVTAGKMVSLRANETPQMAAFVVYGRGQVTETGDVWDIGGRSFIVDAGTIVEGDIAPGDTVYVEGHVQPDGTLVADLITPNQTQPALIVPPDQDDDLIFVASQDDGAEEECVNTTGTVTQLTDTEAILHDGTTINLAEADVEGDVELYSVLLVTTCTGDEGAETVRVVVLESAQDGDSAEDDAQDEDDGDLEDGQQVTICHVPPGNPANAHTITIGQPAVDAHLAHGDFLIGEDAETDDRFAEACDEQVQDEEDDDGQSDGEEAAGRATICHRPPGNPDNAHTITVGESAVDAHLAHGDTTGTCSNGNNGNGRGNNK